MSSQLYYSTGQLRRKRAFDLFVVTLASVSWIPVFLLCSLLILIFEGAPVIYASRRRTGAGTMTVWKFRTMVRNAAAICNRDNTQVEDGVHFLNIDSNSPLYTRIGRLIEITTLTEIPQLFHVLSGKMTLVGNRPLPENVVASLSASYSNVEARFRTPAGLTGPSQLVGRDSLDDAERLRLEATYCRVASQYQVWKLDFMILFYTVLISLRLKPPMTYEEVQRFMMDLSAEDTVYPVIEKIGHEPSQT